LALDIVRETLRHVKKEKLAFIEPAVGTGVFISAIESVAPGRVVKGTGVEIDSDYADIAKQLWGAPYKIIHDDYLLYSKLTDKEIKFDCLCTNPPYVRHHHIDTVLKSNLQHRVKAEIGLKVSGLSGLYVYFILLSHYILSDDAVASWLIPSEFLSVNYGEILRQYLLRHVTLLQLHRFDPEEVQFDDALVSSCVVIYKKRKPMAPFTFQYSFGGSLCKPSIQKELASNDDVLHKKWTFYETEIGDTSSAVLLGDLFDIKRGIATGANDFFIIDHNTIEQFQIPEKFLKSILPSPIYLKKDVIEDAVGGRPLIDNSAFLLDCDLPPEKVKWDYPGLWEYLQIGKARGVSGCYICSHRTLWYQQEKRDPPLFLTTYMGRAKDSNSNPFRFILNLSNAIATNVFLFLYPKPFLKKLFDEDPEKSKRIYEYLSGLEPQHLVRNGRTYGGGLHKLEPKELSNVPLQNIPEWLQVKKSAQPLLPLAI
jgi:hypothetical protein